jgi:hypothetical protein
MPKCLGQSQVPGCGGEGREDEMSKAGQCQVWSVAIAAQGNGSDRVICE